MWNHWINYSLTTLLGALVRLSENSSQMVIDNKPPIDRQKYGVDTVVITEPADAQTVAETYRNFRQSRTPVSEEYKNQKPQKGHNSLGFNAQDTSFEVPKQDVESETRVAAALGTNVGRPKRVMSETPVGRKIDFHFESSDPDETDGRWTQIMVKGLNGMIDEDTLSNAFSQHGDVARVEIGTVEGGVPGQANTENLPYGWVYMRSAEEAKRASNAINETSINKQVVKTEIPVRQRSMPGDSKPDGDPNSWAAWDVFLRSPFVPEALKKPWMRIFEIERATDSENNETFVRKKGADARKRVKDIWGYSWGGRTGENMSRPIDVLGRWGQSGKNLQRLLLHVFREGRQRSGTGEFAVRRLYDDILKDTDVSNYLNQEQTVNVEHHHGFIPAWVRKIRGIQVIEDSVDKVDKAKVRRTGEILTKQVGHKWVTTLKMSNRPLLDAWVNAYFHESSFSASMPKEVRSKIGSAIEGLRDHFDSNGRLIVSENYSLIKTGLLTEGMDTEKITQGQSLDKEALIDYAERFGIQIPDDVTISTLPPRGNMQEWIVYDGVRELYRVREFLPVESVVREARDGSKELRGRKGCQGCGIQRVIQRVHQQNVDL